MINKLKNINENTPISMLAGITNANNKALETEFDYFFDASTGRLTKSVYCPQGSVKTHFGDFQNISVENISIGNPDPIITLFKKNIDRISHNDFIDNFSGKDIENNYRQTVYSDEHNICHDASTIGTPLFGYKNYLGFEDNEVLTAYNVIERCIKKIQSLEKTVKTLQVNAENAKLNTPVSKLNANLMTISDADTPAAPVSGGSIPLPISEPTTYPKQYVGSTIVHLKRMGVHKQHIPDLVSGKYMTYYPAADNVEISNSNIAFIESTQVGQIVNVNLVRTTASPYKILLNRESGKLLKLSTNELNRLQLWCCGYTEEYGPEWDIYSYSVPSKTDIEVIKI